MLLFAALSWWGHAQVLPAKPAAPAKALDPLHRDTPRSAVESFLEACHSKHYDQAWRYIDLRHEAAQQRAQDGPQLAQQLSEVLDRDGRFDIASLSGSPDGLDNDKLPPDRDRVDTFKLNGREVELDLQRISLGSGLQVWMFAADAVPLIPQLARLESSSPIERLLPQPLVEWKLMDTPIWRWIALILLIIVLAPISKLLAWPVLWLADCGAKRFCPRLNRAVLPSFIGPLRLLFCVAVFRAGIGWVGPAPLFRLQLERAASLGFFVAVALLLMAVVDVAIGRVRSRLANRHQSFSYSALPLASRVVKIVIAVLMIAATLSSWGYNTNTILAGLGVGGLAVALAAQKTIENLFGGVAVITDRPVAVGDFCKFGTQVGTVEDVGLRSTRIRTLDRTIVTVPNGEFSTMTLENFSQRDKIWFHTTLNLKRDTSPEQVRNLLRTITRTLKGHPKVEIGEIPVRFINVGTSSLDVEVFAYILTEDSDQFLQIQQDLLLRILDAVHDAGTALAA